MPTALFQLANSTLTNSQILNCTSPNLQLHIVESPFSHLHFYIANLTSLHFYELPKFSRRPPKKSIGCPFFLKVFFAQTLFFWGVFFSGGWGACISGLPSYLLAYILTYLGYLSTYLPTYLGVGPYPHSPTIQDTNS